MSIKKITEHHDKRFILLYLSLYALLLIVGIIVSVLVDIYVMKNGFTITYGFLFTVPFTVLICLGTLFSYDWFLNYYAKKQLIKKTKALVFAFFLCKGIIYIIPILVVCLLYFLQPNNHIFNIFSVFIGMILLWVANLGAQLIMLKIDVNKLVKERSKLQNVPTGDSLANN